jgi:hypothetical protein
MADRVRLVGILKAYAEQDPEGQERFKIFRQSLRSSGWEEEAKARLEVRWLADAAVEQATSSIPVVFVVVTDLWVQDLFHGFHGQEVISPVSALSSPR